MHVPSTAEAQRFGRTMAWAGDLVPWQVGQKRGFLRATIPLKDIGDTSFLEASLKAVED